MSEEMYLVECLEHRPRGEWHRNWWRPNRRGYTFDIDQAGRYSKCEAEDICKIRGAEKAWKESDVLAGKAGIVQRTVVA